MSVALQEELEVLESIYPIELHKISDTDTEIEVEADDLPNGADNIKLTVVVHYPPGYPDKVPEISLKHDDISVNEDDEKKLIAELLKIGAENIGMAMTFTLISHLREQIGLLIREKMALQKMIEAEQERLAVEEEEKRTRGTPVTVESFKSWKSNFDQEIASRKIQEDDEKLKGLTPKEREEWRRAMARLTGRQLFEKHRHLEDEVPLEEGAVSVDFSQYQRTKAEEQEELGLTFSDSD